MQEQVTAAQKILNTIIEYGVNYGFQVIGALIILVIGFMAANWVSKMLMEIFKKKQMDITLSGFVAACAKFTVIGFAAIIALGKFGITITPFVAAISAMALGASFALQGPLSNYGAGLSIIMGRPFVVGNTITVAGVSGVVQEVKLACTVLTDEDNVQITIPNKDIVGQIIHNSKKYKVYEGVVGVSYSESPEKAIQVIQSVVDKFAEVSKDTKPQIGIEAFGDSAINIGYRLWLPTEQYFQIRGAINLAVFNALQQAKISIPFPQREVRILSQS